MNQTDRLRVGLVVGTDWLAWQAHCAALLARTPGVEIAVVVRQAEAAGGAALLKRLRSRSAAHAAVPPPDELRGVPEVSVSPVAGAGLNRLDVLVQLTDGNVPAGVEPVHGIWRFCFGNGDGELRESGVPAFRDGSPVTDVALVRMAGAGRRATVLRRGVYKARQASWPATVDRVLNLAAAWPADLSRRVLAGGAPDGADLSLAPAAVISLCDQALFLLRTAVKRVQELWEGLCFHDEWNIGVAMSPIESFLDPHSTHEIRWLPRQKRGAYLADPFAVATPDGVVILAESYDYTTRKGTICSVRSWQPGQAQTVLEAECHLSYPFLVNHRGRTYCMPESVGAGKVTLFEAISFPQAWSEGTTLIENVKAVDPTVFEFEGRWWLFYTNGETDANAELHIWHAGELCGPWEPHRGNPVKIDVRSSRPGGTPFVSGGALYRPAQDCSRTYGGQLVLNRVTRLTPDEFSEVVATTVSPAALRPYTKGLHTLSGAGGCTVLDAKRRAFAPGALAARVMRLVAGRKQARGGSGRSSGTEE